MRIYSLVTKTVEQGGWTGVSRFDLELRAVLPGLISVTRLPGDLRDDDVVIADNHLSMIVPAANRKIIVHHGCALTHYQRDRSWRSEATLQMIERQRLMFLNCLTEASVPVSVSPSAWVQERFSQDAAPDLFDLEYSKVIPHWVEQIPSLPKSGKPKIIGDWRDHNKGADAWKQLAVHHPHWHFQPLDFKDMEGRRHQYGEASLYLCLSLSEGGSYAVCDAEAAELPIVTTNVGNYREFNDCEVIPWMDRDRSDLVAAVIERKLARGRTKPSFYAAYTFERWASAWQEVISDGNGGLG